MLTIFAGWSMAAAAQEPTTPGQTLRVTTHYVELSVVADTKTGEPVRDLSKQDFHLLDEGQPVQIAVFRREERETSPSPAPLPPGVFSNRGKGAGARNATVILFDALNTRFADQAYARQQILKFLRQIPAGERVALYVLGRGPRVIQDFTDDPSALRQALADDHGELSPSLNTPLYDPAMTAPMQLDAWLGELTFDLYDHFAPERAFRTVRTLIAIANHLEPLPGRKNLVWIAGDFPISFGMGSAPAPRRMRGERTVTPFDLDRVIRVLARADVAVYPIDARGLMAQQEYAGPMMKPQLRNPDTSVFGPMRMLAERTGGRAFYNNNDLVAALRRAQEDASVSYVLGFYPQHHSWNGRFRRIEVRVDRPEVELQYRRGYFAQADEPAVPWYRQGVLDAALWSPIDATGLGLTVQLEPSRSGALGLLLQIDARDIGFRLKDGKWETSLDTWLVQLDGKEHQIKTQARTNNVRLDPATYRRVMEAGGLALREEVQPAAQATLLRVLVRDVGSGALGTLWVPLVAPR